MVLLGQFNTIKMIKSLDSIAEYAAEQIARMLVKMGVKPIIITILRFLLCAPISMYFFSQGTYVDNVIGLFLYMFLALFDWVDGHMATLYKLPSATAPLGRLIDHTSDRILMIIVLGSLLYAGMIGPMHYAWILVGILYYSSFFFLTVSLYEFDRTFKIKFEQYPELEKKMYLNSIKTKKMDIVLYNLLYAHNNSLTRIFFTHNFLLVFGIIFNNLFLVFVTITLMNTIRVLGIFYIQLQVFKINNTNSSLVSTLRTYYYK